MKLPKDKVHIQEIPLRYFPRKTSAKEYRKELVRMMSDLRYANEKVQYSAQICTFNINAIERKSGFVPKRSEVFRQLTGFVYHYENFCFRAYAFREKLLKFINAILALNFEDRDVKVRIIRINPTVIQAKLIPIINKFDKKKSLGRIIEDRNSLTHKLYYGKTFDHYLRPIGNSPTNDKEFAKWRSSWKREVITRSKLTDNFTHSVFEINHDLAAKIIKYKNIARPRKKRRRKVAKR